MRLVRVLDVGIEQVRRSEARRRRGLPVLDPIEIERTRLYGVLAPVPVRAVGPRLYELVARERDWLVAQRAGLHALPVAVLDGLDEHDIERIAATDDVLDPIAHAERLRLQLEALRRERGRGALTALATASGRSRAWLCHRLRLLSLPPAVQAAVSIGALSVGHGKALLTVANDDERYALAARAVDERWSVRRLEREVRGKGGVGPSSLSDPVVPTDRVLAGGPPNGGPRRVGNRGAVDPDVAALERRVGGILGSPVTIDTATGTLTVSWGRDPDVLEGVLARLGVPTA